MKCGKNFEVYDEFFVTARQHARPPAGFNTLRVSVPKANFTPCLQSENGD
jgi:hypothetical protein